MQNYPVHRLSSTLQQKSRQKVGIKIWKKYLKSRDYRCKKVGKVGLFKYKIHYNELLELRKFTVNKQDNSCDNSTN